MTRLFSDTRSTTFDQLAPNSSLACQHLTSMKQNIQGFSLIELMVAVGIMGGMTTLAVPQYGKYKIKAAHTEVKATLANIHAAQELHLVDQNIYADKLPDLGVNSLGTDKPSASKAGQNFLYGKTPGAGIALLRDVGEFNVKPNANDAVEYMIVAKAYRRLASCADTAKFETWCLNNNKLITNDDTTDTFLDGTTARCKRGNATVDASGACF